VIQNFGVAFEKNPTAINSYFQQSSKITRAMQSKYNIYMYWKRGTDLNNLIKLPISKSFKTDMFLSIVISYWQQYCKIFEKKKQQKT
jgi:hypothetical protein